MTRSVFAVTLIISSLVLNRLVGQEETDVDIDQREFKQSLIWIIASIGVIAVMATVIPRFSGFWAITLDTSKELSVTETFLIPRMFGILIATAEEMFFRGFATNLFIARTGTGIGITLSGLFFAAYHFAVYGTNPSLMVFVAGAGIMLSYAAYRTGRVSTTIIAHTFNNFWAGA